MKTRDELRRENEALRDRNSRLSAAVLRRQAEPEPFRLNELAIDYEQRRVTVAGRPVRLTATEFELLRVLAVNAGRVMTYQALLRRKLGDDVTKPTYICNEHGVGYRMAQLAEAGEC